jgi:hypothetical protein
LPRERPPSAPKGAVMGAVSFCHTPPLPCTTADGRGTLVPLHIAASTLGLPQEVLLQWYRNERFEAVDLGILGLWIHRDKVQEIAQ